MKYLVCTAALIACVWGLRSTINEAFATSFTTGMIFCVAFGAVMFAIALYVDRRDRRAQQGQQPPQL